MNCAEFEACLTESMAGEETAGSRAAVLERLRVHARDCGACGGSTELLDWLELPASEREIADDPGPGYWAAFNERLGSRLAAPVRRSRAGLWWAAAVAAALLLLFAGPDLLRQIRSVSSPVSGEAVELPPPGLPETAGTLEAPEMPDELAGMLESVSADELGLVMPWAASSSIQDGETVLGEPVGRPGGLLPDAAGLNDEARGELLQWLREQAQGVSS